MFHPDMFQPEEPTVVSAPGKVLIAGGYLVLDPTYSGVVVSTSSRFYTVIRFTGSPRDANTIQVRSPQFNDSTWSYSVSFDSSSNVKPLDTNTTKNKFVQLALQHTISVACEIKGVTRIQGMFEHGGLDIAIVGDNDFYSQRAQLAAMKLPRTVASLASIQPFCPQGVTLSEVHKTGLGSSASLITSLVTALLLHLKALDPSSISPSTPALEGGRRFAHNLAQFIHCLAQGKVGSGFDVSAAIYGSHIYTRFDPGVIAPLMTESDSTTRVHPVVSEYNKAWNHRIQPFQLPPLTRLMLADVDAGSDTPSLVGKVLKWRQENEAEARAVWTNLDQLNQSLASTLGHLSTLYAKNPSEYGAMLKFLASVQPIQWTADPSLDDYSYDIADKFYQVHEISQNIRKSMKNMGNLAGVPIEPDEQTKLLDKCCSLAGVIAGGVPGAGGYDAIWLLVCDPPDCSPDIWPRERVEYIWSNYTELDVSPLSAQESMAKGAKVEDINEVVGLKKATEIPS